MADDVGEYVNNGITFLVDEDDRPYLAERLGNRTRPLHSSVRATFAIRRRHLPAGPRPRARRRACGSRMRRARRSRATPASKDDGPGLPESVGERSKRWRS
jgi:hypothetical protein